MLALIHAPFIHLFFIHPLILSRTHALSHFLTHSFTQDGFQFSLKHPLSLYRTLRPLFFTILMLTSLLSYSFSLSLSLPYIGTQLLIDERSIKIRSSLIATQSSARGGGIGKRPGTYSTDPY